MKARNMALCALFAALLTICAWIAVPVTDIAFTLQTLGIFLTLGLLGGKWGTAAIAVYLAMGAVGLPVFSGFRGGISVLLGATGGYIWGFLAAGLIYWLLTAVLPAEKTVRLLAMAAGQLGCYVLGTLWYRYLYLQGGNEASFWLVAAQCVLPYLLPDGIKLLLAWILTGRLSRFVY